MAIFGAVGWGTDPGGEAANDDSGFLISGNRLDDVRVPASPPTTVYATTVKSQSKSEWERHTTWTKSINIGI